MGEPSPVAVTVLKTAPPRMLGLSEGTVRRRTRKLASLIGAAALVAGGLLVLTPTSGGALTQIVVANNADSGAGSLRAAFTAANSGGSAQNDASRSSSRRAWATSADVRTARVRRRARRHAQPDGARLRHDDLAGLRERPRDRDHDDQRDDVHTGRPGPHRRRRCGPRWCDQCPSGSDGRGHQLHADGQRRHRLRRCHPHDRQPHDHELDDQRQHRDVVCGRRLRGRDDDRHGLDDHRQHRETRVVG